MEQNQCSCKNLPHPPLSLNKKSSDTKTVYQYQRQEMIGMMGTLHTIASNYC